jgi:peptidoglycan hydrolase-like protein with peptidoglycan-binding domain
MKAVLAAGATAMAAVAAMTVLPAATASAATLPVQCVKSGDVQNMIMPVLSTGSTHCSLGTYSGSLHKPAVEVLQAAMNICFGKSVLGSVYPLEVDGIFGPDTKLALERVQSHIGVSPDGEYGPLTRAHMLWENENTGTPCVFDGGA